jgi:hypothetical protein
MGRIQPVVADRRLGAVYDRQPVHERRWAEGWLAGKTGVDEGAGLRVEAVRVAGGKLHEEVVRMLTVHQRCLAIGGLAGGQQ